MKVWQMSLETDAVSPNRGTQIRPHLAFVFSGKVKVKNCHSFVIHSRDTLLNSLPFSRGRGKGKVNQGLCVANIQL